MAMELDEAEWLLDNIRNPLVMIDPRQRGGHCNGAWMKARLMSTVGKEHAMIIPTGHRREERVELKFLKKWNSRNHFNGMKDGSPMQVYVPPPPLLRSEPLAAKIGDFLQKVALTVPAEEPVKVVPAPKEATVPSPIDRFANPIPEDAKLEVVRLREMGKTYREIQTITGLKYGSLGGIVRKLAPHLVDIEAEPRTKIAKVKTKTAEKPPVMTPVREEPKPAPTPTPHANTAAARTPASAEQVIATLRQIMQLQVTDTQKLLAIEALIA